MVMVIIVATVSFQVLIKHTASSNDDDGIN